MSEVRKSAHVLETAYGDVEFFEDDSDLPELDPIPEYSDVGLETGFMSDTETKSLRVRVNGERTRKSSSNNDEKSFSDEPKPFATRKMF